MSPADASRLLTHTKDIDEWYRTKGSQGYLDFVNTVFSIPLTLAAPLARGSSISGFGRASKAAGFGKKLFNGGRHVLKVLANPATAKTTTGFLTATGIDAAGTIYGLQRNSELLNK